MRGDSYFSLQDATFHEVPDFEQAHFAEAPRLDVAHFNRPRVQPGRFWRWTRARVKADDKRTPGGAAEGGAQSSGPSPTLPDTTARWRALKRLAVQGHDHEREMMFFAEELKSLRGRTDKLLPNFANLFRDDKRFWPGGARYWFGLFYQGLSNFGGSILLPLFWWSVGVVVFAAMYLSVHLSTAQRWYGAWAWLGACLQSWVPKWVPLIGSTTEPPSLPCIAGTDEAWGAALHLSVRKSLLFSGLNSPRKLDELYACLFGLKAGTTGPLGELPLRYVPEIPNVVSLLGLLQLLISSILIFLLLLAVRNQFRIK